MEEEVQTFEPALEKVTRAERFKRSVFARLRRKDTKSVIADKALKEEKEAKERLKLKRELKKMKKSSK